jgi:hypothetical protein
MITPRMIDTLWKERETELIRRAELVRKMNDGEVVLSDGGNYRIVERASQLFGRVRALLGTSYVQVPEHEHTSEVLCP